MIILKNSKVEIQKQMKNAIAKCRNLEIKPRVKMIEPNKYEVLGNQNRYTVKMRIGAQGAKIIDCNCRAGEEGMVCYHVAAAYGVHVGLVTMNRSEMR